MQTKNNCPQGQRFEVADIFRLYGDKYRNQNRLSKEQLKVMRHIADCRTAAMGGHTMVCMNAVFSKTSIIPAGIGIVPNVRQWSRKNG